MRNAVVSTVLACLASSVSMAQFMNPELAAKRELEKKLDDAAKAAKEAAAKAYLDLQRAAGTQNNSWNREQKNNASAAGPRGFAETGGSRSEWRGKWVRSTCSETGGSTDSCAAQPMSGPLRILMTDHGASVGGTIELGMVEVIFSGIKDASGQMSLAGYGREDGSDITITNWSAARAGTAMTGSFTLAFHPDEASLSTVIVRAVLQDVDKIP